MCVYIYIYDQSSENMHPLLGSLLTFLWYPKILSVQRWVAIKIIDRKKWKILESACVKAFTSSLSPKDCGGAHHKATTSHLIFPCLQTWSQTLHGLHGFLLRCCICKVTLLSAIGNSTDTACRGKNQGNFAWTSPCSSQLYMLCVTSVVSLHHIQQYITSDGQRPQDASTSSCWLRYCWASGSTGRGY